MGSRSPQDHAFDLKYKPAGYLHGDIGDGAGWITTTADASTIFQTNVWYHVACVATTNGYAIYQDGVQLTNASYASAAPLLFDVNHVLNLGRGHPNEYLTGEMDEVRIWNVARTGAEISANKNKALRGDETGLVQYYRFDEGGGSTVGDSAAAGGSSTGNLVNGPVFVPSGINFTIGSLPSVETLGAVVTNSSLRLGGTANPAATNTVAWFEWGTTTNYGNIADGGNLGSGTTNVDFNALIANVDTNATYHFRAIASNSLGMVVIGADKTFPIVPPLLAIGRQTNVFLSWQITTPAFLLEQSTNLSSTNWTTLYGATVSNGLYQVTLPVDNVSFYRLRQLTNGPITSLITYTNPLDPEIHGQVPICPILDDAENYGCVVPNAFYADYTYKFYATGIVDPNRRPNDPAPTFHWEIFFPEEEGSAKYTCAGISGYFAPILTILPNSLPDLIGPLILPSNQWRFRLSVTHHSTDPLSTGTETTVIGFRIGYSGSALSTDESSRCQNPALPHTDCIPSAVPTTEPN